MKSDNILIKTISFWQELQKNMRVRSQGGAGALFPQGLRILQFSHCPPKASERSNVISGTSDKTTEVGESSGGAGCHHPEAVSKVNLRGGLSLKGCATSGSNPTASFRWSAVPAFRACLLGKPRSAAIPVSLPTRTMASCEPIHPCREAIGRAAFHPGKSPKASLAISFTEH